MAALIALHILAGALAMLAGFGILLLHKGGAMHRRVGQCFVNAMLVLGVTGAVIALVRWIPLSLLNGLLLCYFVLTSQVTLRHSSEGWRYRNQALAVFGAALLVGYVWFALQARAAPGGMLGGFGMAAYIVFGLVTALAVLGDVRCLWSGARTGRARLFRHLWRMLFPLFMATAAFFLGQAKLFPPVVQQSPYLLVPVLVVIIAIAFWGLRVYFAREPFARGHNRHSASRVSRLIR